MSRNYFLLTVFGKDRPGIVAGISQAICHGEGNIADASMTRLGGEFTMMVVCDFPKKLTSKALQNVFQPWQKKLGLELTVRPITSTLARTTRSQPAQFLISVYGTDRAGLVHQVAQALADRHLSITDLHTRVLTQSPKSLYVMLLEVSGPETLDIDDLRTELDRLRQTLGVEITLQDIDPIAL